MLRVAVAAAGLLCAGLASAAASADSPQQRAAVLLQHMNVSEKVTLLHGGCGDASYTGCTAPVPRLGIPGLKLNDGRQGFRPNSGSKTNTAFPAAVQVVASFDVNTMYSFGRVMGEEFACKGSNVMLAPMLILARVPLDGRIFESTGADPELAYAFAYHMISGAQSNVGVIANADDFVLNNQESDRGDISAVADERTLFELYYRGYKGAVDAGVGSFMCSYNRVNGTHACENEVTLGDLKSEQGLNFSGWVLSDWGGVHSTVASALNGLDQQMPDDSFFGAALLAAIASGEVPMSVIDDKVTRILVPMFRAGLFDVSNNGTQDTNCTSASHAAAARELAAAGTVLLTNPGGLLPLDAASPLLRTILVIGNDGDLSPQCCGAGSGYNNPPYIVTPLAGIRARTSASGQLVTYAPSPPTAGGGLTTFFSPIRQDHFLDFVCEECPDDYVALRLEGYGFGSAACPDGVTCEELVLWYDSAAQSNVVTTAAFPPVSSSYSKIKTQAFALPLSYPGPEPTVVLELWLSFENSVSGKNHCTYFTLASSASRAEAVAMGFHLVAPIARLLTQSSGADIAAIAKLAAAADVAVLCVSTPSSEGSDRPNLDLAADDDALIVAVLAAQLNTVVVLNSPAAIVMPWAPQAGAIVAGFYPGQELGNALADVLFGDVNPAARLPLTFPMRDSDNPLPTPAQYPGINGTVTYSERLLIDYRWFDASGVEPRFAFGHGLSYTEFRYANLTVDTQSQAPNVLVACDITNTGSRDGKEVPQLYITFPDVSGEPPQVLRGFVSVAIARGSSAHVVFSLSQRDLSIWGVRPVYAWVPQHGPFGVAVGASSRDIRLRGSFEN